MRSRSIRLPRGSSCCFCNLAVFAALSQNVAGPGGYAIDFLLLLTIVLLEEALA